MRSCFVLPAALHSNIRPLIKSYHNLKSYQVLGAPRSWRRLHKMPWTLVQAADPRGLGNDIIRDIFPLVAHRVHHFLRDDIKAMTGPDPLVDAHSVWIIPNPLRRPTTVHEQNVINA